MSKAADYFGLMAYMFVMYGGLPGSDSLWSDTAEPERARRQRPKLKIVASGADAPKRKRRTSATATAQEFAA
jgi:hypothetical protein